MADISKIKPNGSTGTEYNIKDATARSAIENKANDTQTFTEASTRANIASGENMATLFGKIKKFFTDLKTVAFTGSYSDLSNKPTIPTITDTYSGTSSNGMSGKAVKSAIDALDGTVSGSAGSGKTLTAFSQTDGKVSATFGNISITKSQISDFPTIPTVNNATLTIQKNGTTVKTFTANASSNVTANITMSKSDVGLGNVDNTADADKIVSGAKKVFWSSDPNGSGAYVSGYAAGRNQVENNNDTIPTGAAVVSYLNTKLGWKVLKTAFTPTSDMYVDLLYDMTTLTEVVMCIRSTAYNQPMIRQTMVLPNFSGEISTYGIFPDFTWGGVRYYCYLKYVSNTRIQIKDLTAGSGGNWSLAQLSFYCKQ